MVFSQAYARVAYLASLLLEKGELLDGTLEVGLQNDEDQHIIVA